MIRDAVNGWFEAAWELAPPNTLPPNVSRSGFLTLTALHEEV